MANVWEPIFAKPMLEMAKLRSLLFQVPNMQFSRDMGYPIPINHLEVCSGLLNHISGP